MYPSSKFPCKRIHKGVFIFPVDYEIKKVYNFWEYNTVGFNRKPISNIITLSSLDFLKQPPSN